MGKKIYLASTIYTQLVNTLIFKLWERGVNCYQFWCVKWFFCHNIGGNIHYYLYSLLSVVLRAGSTFPMSHHDWLMRLENLDELWLINRFTDCCSDWQSLCWHSNGWMNWNYWQQKAPIKSWNYHTRNFWLYYFALSCQEKYFYLLLFDK